MTDGVSADADPVSDYADNRIQSVIDERLTIVVNGNMRVTSGYHLHRRIRTGGTELAELEK
jgi:hypothetical protein